MCSLVINSQPKLKDLYNLITPEYAAHWKDIGALLDVKKGILDGIERNFPSNVSWCSNELLEKWLESNEDASWKKLIQAIDKLAVTTSATANLSTAVISPQSLSGNNLVILLCMAVILFQMYFLAQNLTVCNNCDGKNFNVYRK